MTTHWGAEPEQAPDHPENTDEAFGDAINVTVVPCSKVAPVGAVAIVPPPVPVVTLTSSYVFSAKVADTERGSVIVTVHVVAVPEQAPDQPVNTDDELAAAISVTVVP